MNYRLLTVCALVCAAVNLPLANAADSLLLQGPPGMVVTGDGQAGLTVLYQDDASSLLLARRGMALPLGLSEFGELDEGQQVFLADLPAGADPADFGVNALGQLAGGAWVILAAPGEDLPYTLPGERIRLSARGIGQPRTVDQRAASARQQNADYNPDIQALADQPSADRLRELVQTLEAFQTRFSYSGGCLNAVNWAANFLRDQDLAVELHSHTPGMAPNVIARRQGSVSPDRIWILCAHIDSVSLRPQEFAPGADDNGSGSALVLHAAEILREQKFEDTVLFALWTGEEQGLFGSSVWAEEASAAGLAIQGVLNFDMIGWVSPAPEDLNIVVNRDSQAFGDEFAGALSTYTGLPYRIQVQNGMVYSDHAPFWYEGYPAFCGIEDNPINYPDYHKVTDTWDKLDFAFTADVTRASIAGLCAFARPAGAEPTEDVQITLTLPAADYHGGDEFWLWYEITRRGPALAADLYLVLDVAGNYYFFPEWTTGLQSAEVFVPADGVTAQEVLRFILPRPLPPGGPFSFVSVLTSPGSYELLSGICSREFNFW